MKTTILVVDDAAMIREVTAALLRQAGFDVIEGGTGEEALRLARGRTPRPDLVVLDVHLPDLDGMEVCRRLKSDPETESIPVLHLSGTFREVEDRVRGLESGADGYLTKPVGRGELIATVNALLRLRRAESSLRESEVRRRAAEALVDVGRLLARSLDPLEVSQRVADSVRGLLEARASALFQLDPGSGDLTMLAGSGDVDAAWGHAAAVPRGTGLAAVALRERQPVASVDLLEDDRITYTPEERARLHDSGYRAGLAVPLVVEDRLMGALVVRDLSGRVFGENDIRVVQAFADQAATALENARLFQESELRRRRLATLVDVAQRLTRGLELDSVLDSIAEAAAAVFEGEAGFRLLEGEELVRRGATPGAREVMVRERLRIGEFYPGVVAATGEAMITDDVQADPRFLEEHRTTPRPSNAGALLCVPMRLGGRVLGTLQIYRERGYRFDRDALQLAESLADQAAIAIENARLYRQAQQAYEDLARTQSQLLHAQKMEAVGRLAGGVAHDFNNLLTVIEGRSQMLLHRLAPEDPLRRHVLLIQQTSDRAAALTRQLLAFSRKQLLQPKVLDLNQVLLGMREMLHRLIGEHIDLIIMPDPTLGSVKVDPGQVEQVVLNLAVNARDAMREGGRLVIETDNVDLDEVFARGHTGARAGAYVRLTVTDSGDGMSAETLAHLFEPFFTTKGPGKGTGLGLATAYGIVEQSAGYITVESEPGRGARFTIYLPRVGSAGPPAPGAPPVLPLRRATETILLVEDEEALRSLAREVLAEQGYTVLAAQHPSEALMLAERHDGRIHLVLTDVVMPHMSGRELADRMLALRPETQILYMSGYTDDAIIHHGVLDAGTAFLAKPFTPDSLARKVRDVLDGVRA